MNLTRIIHPVGQGAFYTEQICFNNEYFNVVYDCGGSTKEVIEKRIDCYLNLLRKQQDNPTIDAVFISHFHRDHINGLLYLRSKSHIKKLYIPQLSEELFLEEYIYNLINEDNETNELLIQLYTDRFEENIFKINESETIHIFEIWKYIAYNPKILDDSEIKNFYEEFKKIFTNGNNFSYKDLPNIIKDDNNLKKCIKIYEKFFGKNNHNSYSMTLFSGTQKPIICDEILINKKNYKCLSNCCRKDGYIKNPNCLYTGDFDIKKQFNDLKTFYDNLNLWNTIKTIQVPHHCSRNNYYPTLYSNICSCFISVGTNNNYKHPNIDTLINIQNEVCDVNIVTEHINTIKIYDYSFFSEGV